MSFYRNYDLERLIADGEAKTFRARENASGREVLLHMFARSGEALLASIKTKLMGSDGKPVWPLIEVGEFAGNPYAVTDADENFTNLRDWLADLEKRPLVSPPPKPITQPPGPAMEAAPTGDFTRIFGQSAPPSTSTSQLDRDFASLFGDVPAVEPARPPLQPVPRPMPEPGEFTRMFQAPVGPSASAAPDPIHRTDEFERLFGSSKPPATDPARAESLFQGPPAIADTGEFTRLFGRGPSGEQINIEEEQARAAGAPVPESRPFQAAGEFTRMFGPQSRPQAPPARQPAAAESVIGSASKLFGSDAAPTVRTAIPQPNSQSGPGEYTRIIQVPKDLAQDAPPLTVAPAEVGSKRGLIVGLSIGAALLLIAVIALIVTYARAHSGPPQP